jgi:hypothetical protein
MHTAKMASDTKRCFMVPILTGKYIATVYKAVSRSEHVAASCCWATFMLEWYIIFYASLPCSEFEMKNMTRDEMFVTNSSRFSILVKSAYFLVCMLLPLNNLNKMNLKSDFNFKNELLVFAQIHSILKSSIATDVFY